MELAAIWNLWSFTGAADAVDCALLSLEPSPLSVAQTSLASSGEVESSFTQLDRGNEARAGAPDAWALNFEISDEDLPGL